MRDDSNQILDDLLSRWHTWCKGFRLCPEPGADPMFRGVKSGRRNWDSLDDIIDEDLTNSTMEGVDFEVSEMPEPHRSAIYAHARNLASRHTVWASPRLPQDPTARAILVGEARHRLMSRLLLAGIM